MHSVPRCDLLEPRIWMIKVASFNSLLSVVFSDLLQCMLGGMQSHLDSSVVRIRHMGMVVGECLSSRMDISGTKLKFEVQL